MFKCRLNVVFSPWIEINWNQFFGGSQSAMEWKSVLETSRNALSGWNPTNQPKSDIYCQHWNLFDFVKIWKDRLFYTSTSRKAMPLGKFSHNAIFGLMPEDFRAREIANTFAFPHAKSIFDILRQTDIKIWEDSAIIYRKSCNFAAVKLRERPAPLQLDQAPLRSWTNQATKARLAPSNW